MCTVIVMEGQIREKNIERSGKIRKYADMLTSPLKDAEAFQQ